jgi:hypothetical protein
MNVELVRMKRGEHVAVLVRVSSAFHPWLNFAWLQPQAALGLIYVSTSPRESGCEIDCFRMSSQRIHRH